MGVRQDHEYDGTKPPEWADHTHVDVDVTSLKDFSDHLLAEYQHNLAPNWKKIAPQFQQSEFGKSPGFEEAFFVGRRHDHILTDARTLVENYAAGLSALSDAATRLSEEYGGVDDLSALDVTKAQVDAAFKSGDGSTTSAPPAATPPPPVS